MSSGATADNDVLIADKSVLIADDFAVFAETGVYCRLSNAGGTAGVGRRRDGGRGYSTRFYAKGEYVVFF